MDPYQQVRKTSLKLKRTAVPKREVKPAASTVAIEKPADDPRANIAADEPGVPPASVASDDDVPFDLNKEIDALLTSKSLTRAEKSHKLAQLCKKEEDLRQKLSKSHKQKIAEFNQQLSALGEHFDIPKVGPG